MAFTPFWTSTVEAYQRTRKQGYHRHRKLKRAMLYNPDRYFQITLPRGRFTTVRRQIKAIQKSTPYKLRKSELKQLELFLINNRGLHYLVLPKQRVNDRSIDFNDTKLKWVDKEG